MEEVNIMNKEISRRDFLRFSGLAVGGALATACMPPVPTEQSKAPVSVGNAEGNDGLVSAPDATSECRVVHDYNLRQDDTEVATDSNPDSLIHTETYTNTNNGSGPEMESVLDGGRYRVNQENGVRGHVWEYDGCTREQVERQVDKHIERRLGQKANNVGWAPDFVVKELFTRIAE
jgi:hypothetical protein